TARPRGIGRRAIGKTNRDCLIASGATAARRRAAGDRRRVGRLARPRPRRRRGGAGVPLARGPLVRKHGQSRPRAPPGVGRPMGYVFSMAYPESVVLAAIAGAGAAAAHRRWRLAAVLAAVAAAGRPEGVFVAVPLLALALRPETRSQRRELAGALAATASAPAALAAVAAYQRLIVGDPLAFSHAQIEW